MGIYRIFPANGFLLFRQAGVPSLARFFSKMHNHLNHISGNMARCHDLIVFDYLCYRQKNTLATKEGRSTRAQRKSFDFHNFHIYYNNNTCVWQGLFSRGDIFLRLLPQRFLWYKNRTSSQKERRCFPGISDFYRSFAGFFVFWSNFPRVSPCFPLQVHLATVLQQSRHSCVRCFFLSCSFFRYWRPSLPLPGPFLP